jgi:hypothetical protein
MDGRPETKPNEINKIDVKYGFITITTYKLKLLSIIK